MDKLNMGIVGHGFVGKAVEFGFQTESVSMVIADPKYGSDVNTLFENTNPDIVFVCVPTPMGFDGMIDSSIIEQVFRDIAKQEHQPVVVAKSTITPDIVRKLKDIYPKTVYNPEFLTERNYQEDFVNAEMLILGGDREHTEFVFEVYHSHSKCKSCPVWYVDVEAASMLKYTINTFLATKVLFFNQLNSIFENTGTQIEWDNFLEMLTTDPRIGKSHMTVPGPDGRKGFGGACFPKDTAALANYARKKGARFTVLEEAIKANQVIRSQYDDLDDREKEQNVNFKLFSE